MDKSTRDRCENFVRSYARPFDTALMASRCGISTWSARHYLRIFRKWGLVKTIATKGQKKTYTTASITRELEHDIWLVKAREKQAQVTKYAHLLGFAYLVLVSCSRGGMI